MPDYYFDTSALLKLYIQEDGSAGLRQMLDQSEDNRVFILELTLLEARSAIRRRERAREITTAAANGFLTQIDQDGKSRYFVERISAQVIAEAHRLIDNHPIRALDALQLAGCILLSQAYHLSLIFVCADYDLCAAATAERIATLNPLQPS